jgi:hypothetical protein
MSELTIEKIDKIIEKLQNEGGKPTHSIMRCPFCHKICGFLHPLVCFKLNETE